MTLDEFEKACAAGDIDTVLVCFVDMQGRLIGKRFHARFFIDSGYAPTHACDYLLANDIAMEPVPGYAAASWGQGYGDFVLQPDMRTLRCIPWLDGTALVLCDVLDHQTNEDLPHSPRAILRRQVGILESLGMRAFMASELEFYLFDESYATARQKSWAQLNTAGHYVEDYHIFQTTREEGVMRAIRNGLDGAGIPVENSKGEWGPGQEEINVRYADALEMADRHAILKNGCKEIASQNDKAVTFMAKWNTELAGSSAHIHQSLWDLAGKQPLFFDQGAEHGMSELLQHYLAGQLAYARELTWFLAPYVNSYKRFQSGTFAPTKAVWSLDNRTAGFRLCGESSAAIRVECRIGGADLNPYLAFAALLAAGCAGIRDQMTLEAGFAGDAYRGEKLREIPKTLRAATAEMRQSAMLRDALGEEVVDHYVRTAEWEQSEHDRVVTDHEVRRGFEQY
ncbi:MAG: glutamine synthetase family protein [Gammaproteobacteria bacterium]|nr:MAG: glutamine synthetase family protein [Gammaproteobacteria bacterium]